MKRLLLLSLSIVVFFACKDAGNRTKVTNEIQPLHFTFTTSHNIEPIALLNLGGLYHLIYGTSDEPDIRKTNIIGQAISEDLINWSESSKAVFPKYNNSLLKGGIIIDSNNITGYGTSESPPLVAVLIRIEIGDSINQGMKKAFPILAFSTDDGNLWAVTTDKINFPPAFINNPQNVGICWHQPTKKWIMSIALNDHVELYSSADLRLWNFESLLGTDFFPEEIKWKRTTLFSSGDGIHWVLLVDIKKSGKHQTAGGTVYFIGYFDGHSFLNQSSQLHWLDYGEDIYGSLISTGCDGRTINVGWRNNNDKQSSKNNNHFSPIITLPRELNLENSNTEWFITASPVLELKKIYGKDVKLEPVKVSYKVDDLQLISGVKAPFEVFLKFNTSDIQKGSFPTRFGVSFWNSRREHMTFGFDRFGYYYIDKSGLVPSLGTQIVNDPIRMPSNHSDSTMSLRLIVDISTIECFTEGGKLVMTSTYSSSEPFNRLKLFAVNGNIDFLEGKIIELRTSRP
ncbi:MAG: GH32 C-terminal domain-containing protein [Chitinophagaceae bacterium]